MSRVTFAWILLAAVAGTACDEDSPGRPGPQPLPQPTPLPEPTPTPTPEPTPEPTPTPTPTPPASCLPACAGSRAYDARSYDLRAKLDWATRTLAVEETISLIATTDAPIVTLDADGLVVSAVHAGDQLLAYAVDETEKTLRVDLTPLAPSGAAVTFTVEYVAVESESLYFIEPRPDDPAQSSVVYTISEPIYGSRWLAAKHDPSDRALFSITLEVPREQDVIANGHRLTDDLGAESRVVRYEMDRPLPTYLMAFAAGDLIHADRSKGGTPLSLWYRRGLAIDPTINLDIVADAMKALEQRLGPYPFDSYATVLVPEFKHGGMEHATITFNQESSGLRNGNVNLNAHELAHHWFGDWVTMRTYDDLWVKEGMATLLAAEVTRSTRDLAHDNRLFGGDFRYQPGDAIVDEELTGIAKYTSGPYQRGAWVITQIRQLVGEEAFWTSLRGVLHEYALDSIDGESFVRSFAPALDESTISKLLASLDEHVAPALEIEAVATDTGTDVTFDLSDPSAVLVAPFAVTVVDALGVATEVALGSNVATTVTVPHGGYLAPDEQDVHPWRNTFAARSYRAVMPRLLWPAALEARHTLESRSARHQETALEDGWFFVDSPDELAGLVQRLDSNRARWRATIQGCSLATWTGDPAPWYPTLAALLREPAVQGYEFRAGACGSTVPRAILAPELRALLDQPTVAALARLDYLISFDYGVDTLALIGRIVTESPSLMLRDDAMWRLTYEIQGWAMFPPLSDDQRDAWKAFYRDRLAETSSAVRFEPVWFGVTGLQDVAALPVLGRVFDRLSLRPQQQRDVLCEAHALAADSAAWDALVEASHEWTHLAPAAAEVLADPAVCQP